MGNSHSSICSHTDPTGVAEVAETVRGMFNLWKSIVLLMQGNGILCVLSASSYMGNEKQKVSAGNVHVESKTKDGNGKTKQRKAKVWLREVCRKKESQKKKNECRNTAKQCWRELTLEIGSIPKRQIKEAP